MNEGAITIDILSIEFQYYAGGIYNVMPLSEKITLLEFFLEIINPESKQAQLSLEIKQAKEKGDEVLRSRLKRKSIYYTPAAIATSRNSASIIRYTGFMPLDFDAEGVDYAKRKIEVFKHPSIIASWHSASGKLHALAWVKTANSKAEYHSLFWGLHNEFPDFDIMMQTPTQPFFYSHDPEALIKAEPVEMWVGKALHPKFSWEPPRNMWLPPITSANHKQEMIFRWMLERANKIVDNGHPQIRSIAAQLGGYAAEGYFSEQVAFEFACCLIDANSYLSIKPATYKVTARSAIKHGMRKPKRLKIDE